VRSLALETISVRNVRNLSPMDLEFGPRFNVLSGQNGQGKTNLIESIYLLATSKSFRSTRVGAVIRHGEEIASIKGVILEEGEKRTQSVGLKVGMRVAQIEGKTSRSLASYAVRTPVVAFHPGEVSLSMGGGGERRRLLDRLSLYINPSGASALGEYTQAIRERQRALELRGLGARDLDEWEELVVRYGLALMATRRAAASRIAETADDVFSQIAAKGMMLTVAYAPGAPEEPEVYRAALANSRRTDARRGSASLGPHRDDLALCLGEQPVRDVASQGQHRAIVLALKLAEVRVIGLSRGVRPLLLLDDVSSELDPARTAALFEFLRRHQGQVFLTTTRPDLLEIGDGNVSRHFTICDGQASGLGSL
jgi:DNA replication and repair protein RecF